MIEAGGRLRSLSVITTVLLFTLVGRVTLLGTIQSRELRKEAERSLQDVNPLPSTRGRILARDGRVLVDNLATNVVKFDVSKLKKREATAVLARLAGLFGVSFSNLEAKLSDPRNARYEPAVLAKNVKESAVVFIAEHQDAFPGVQTAVTWQRVYPYGRLASHVLGYLGRVTPEDIKGRPASLFYQKSDLIGRSGIEKSFEADLRGIPGEEIVTKDPTGKVVDRQMRRAPVPGKDVRLAIDIGLQSLAESTLSQGVVAARGGSFQPDGGGPKEPIKAPAGALVCFNDTTGEVAASASYPDYDPREFVDGLSLKREAEYQSPENHAPLINRVIEGQYPPGSTFKLFTALAALRFGLITPNTTYEDKGAFEDLTLKNKTKYRWTNAGKPPAVFGIIDLRNAIRVSSDAFFYKLGWDFHRGKVNENGIQQVAREMGLGKYTNIQLPQEAKGVIPDRERQAKLHERFPTKFRADWPLGATINVSIGQGDVLVTPLQLVRAYAAFANGGTVLDAKIALELLDRSKTDSLLSSTPTAEQSSTNSTAETNVPVTATLATPRAAAPTSSSSSTVAVPLASTLAAVAASPTTVNNSTVTTAVRSILGVQVPVTPTLPPAKIEPAVEGHVDIPDSARGAILGGLMDVLGKHNGTAAGAFQGFDLSKFPLAGKTGTAQKPPQQDYSVFVAFGPIPKPVYTCGAVIEEGGFGRQAGALVRRMFEGIAGFPIEPVKTVTEGGAER